MEITREELLKHLKTSKTGVEITFEKADGTKRVMQATLNVDLLPKREEETTKKATKKKPRAENSDLVVVYDMEKSGWRSFKMQSLVKVSVMWPDANTLIEYLEK
ncbi:MAG: hypothetical protein COA52_00485 [Hyphomicrobiales bacterium]|nr:MAG: hypothetical protein COA52_00485 [Hyphomicrobiales bacterium]